MSLSYGVNANLVNSSTYGSLVSTLKSVGSDSVRVWLGAEDLNSRSEGGVFKYIRRFKSEGFKVMAVVDFDIAARNNPTGVAAFTKWLTEGANLASSVDYWQIGNEPDREWGRSNYAGAVNNIIKPAYEVLHAAGEKVVSPGPSWNPDDIKLLADQGMLNYVDYVGYHPYRSNLADLKLRVSQAKAYSQGKPMIAAEWNARGHETEADRTGWANAVKEFWPVIRDNFYAAYYYAGVKSDSFAGPAGLMNTDGSHNEPFYSAFKGLPGGGGGTYTPTPIPEPTPTPIPVPTPTPTPVPVPVPVPTPTPVPTPVPVPTPTPTPVPVPTPPPTNVPSTNSKPYVGGFKIQGATGTALAGFSNVTADSLTIKLSSLSTRNIQIAALVNSATSSVTFAFTGKATRIENTAPFTAFANSAGQEATWYATAGTYTLTVTTYSLDNAKGTIGNSRTLTLKFT